VPISLECFADSGARRLLLKLARRFAIRQEVADVTADRAWLTEASQRIERRICPELQFVGNVLCDLAGQGWSASVHKSKIVLQPPSDIARPTEAKARVRAAHLVERNAQLALPAVRKFITSMESRRLHNGHWRSILSLVQDGPELANKLQSVASIADEPARGKALREYIDPYIQVIGPKDVCAFTGLRLLDVWRYFRHTWTTAYQSTPGRKMFVLVRNRAQPCHPVIGLGALSSAVVQLSVRDAWIGWSVDDVVNAFRAAPLQFKEWLLAQADELIEDVFTDDFVRQSVLTRREISLGSHEAAKRLRRVAEEAKAAHRLDPEPAQHKAVSRLSKIRWREQATTNLFRWKRAATLSQLLIARRALLDITSELGNETFDAPAARQAVSTIVRGIKAKHIGIDVMDITVCGAIAPYNHLLAGKLVSLLMASSSVTSAYEKRYKGAPSLIASSMGGRALVRRPSLVLLGTTSLYGTGASQYHRLHMPIQNGSGSGRLEFVELGRTAGYGSFHYSADTMVALEAVLRRGRRGRAVNSIFGEGVNPKLRKLRAGFDAVGLPSELLLKHGSPRLVYAIPLAHNFREVLLGMAKRPRWIVPRDKCSTETIIDYWVRRWLVRRVARTESMEAIQKERLTHPQTHSAKVPTAPDLDLLPFDEHGESDVPSLENAVRRVS
jgi:hypothetical protein